MNLPTNPAFCFITPISYMEQCASASTRHLVLAHLVDRDDRYATWYKHRSDQGDFIMMDNSAYELHEPYSPEKLISLSRKCGAHAVVLPDYPFQPAEKTISAAEKFIPLFKEEGLFTFFVPQSTRGATEGWISCYLWAANNPDVDIIGMSILGIPNALPNIDPAYARVVMTSILQDRGLLARHKYHHYLGLNSGVNLEIPSLLRMNALNSIDSSGPVWSALLGHAYTTDTDSYQAVSKIKVPVDFNLPKIKDAATDARLKNNIDLTLSLFNGDIKPTDQWFAKE